MAGAAEIARLLTQGTAPLAGDQDNALHTGTIVSWDRFTGANSVRINGVILPNLDSLQSGIGISYTPGDVVVIQRKQTKYYIMGKVASPLGSAGSAPAFVTNNISYTVGSQTPGWADFADGGPAVTTYIGSSRTALVMWNGTAIMSNAEIELGFTVSGASSVASGSFTGMTIIAGQHSFDASVVTNSVTVSGIYLMGGGAGLNKGQNTFKMQYRNILFPTGTGTSIGNRGLTVIPL